jgi:hypothetical protein
MPPLVIAAAIGAAGIVGSAAIQSGATGDAAATQAATADKAIAFQKQQAEQLYQQQNTTNQANYDQWAANQGRLNSAGEMLGLPTSTIPPFRPMPDPNFTGTPSVGQVVGPGANPTPAQPAQPPPAYAPPQVQQQAPRAGAVPQSVGAYLAPPQPMQPAPMMPYYSPASIDAYLRNPYSGAIA